MVDDIYEFLESNLNDSQYDQYKIALNIIDNYSRGSVVYSDILSVISDSGYSSDEKIILIYKNIVGELDKVLLRHGIKISEDVGMDDKVEILYSLLVIQMLDGYEGIARYLECMEDDIEVFSVLVSDYSTLSKVRVYEIVEELSEDFLEGLKRYVRDREIEVKQSSEREFKNRADCIKKHITSDCLILKSGIALGANFSSYIGMLGEHLSSIKDVDVIVRELVCMLLLSAEGKVDARTQWDKYIGKYVTDAGNMTKADVSYHKYVQKYLDGVRLKGDSLSVTSGT